MKIAKNKKKDKTFAQVSKILKTRPHLLFQDDLIITSKEINRIHEMFYKAKNITEDPRVTKLFIEETN